jgi:glutamyl-tRNA synthetase
LEEPETDEKAWKKVMKEGSGALLASARAALGDVDPFEPDQIEKALEPVLAEHDVKPGKLYQPIRVAISGGSVSPGIFESLAVLGKERSLARIAQACDRLDSSTKGG